jgi:hypothetical protein
MSILPPFFKGFLTSISKEFELIHGLQKGQNGFQCDISLKIHTQRENICSPIRGSDKSTAGTILIGEGSLGKTKGHWKEGLHIKFTLSWEFTNSRRRAQLKCKGQHENPIFDVSEVFPQ